ncbi:MAG TPA: tetraacyldisaccharide 4'-kinase [Fimbriimonas sp.]|nr:tetraacyldisaccharide 4'-kinase [Fimbriimonas sp.]
MARIEQFWVGDDLSSKVTRLALTPLSWLYSGGWAVYQLVYKLGLKKPYQSSIPIVCIGNFVAGGTGKTPVVIHVASVLQSLGFSVVIGCSGYGSPKAESATIAPAGDLDPAEWGDEPSEIRMALPELPMVVGRRRVLAAQLVEKEFPNAVLLMDDGLQHMPLAKTVSIALDPPNGNQRTFPAGPYREPRRMGEKRVDVVLPNQSYSVQFSDLIFEKNGEGVPRPSKSVVLTAIGQPEKFIEGLVKSGVEIEGSQLEQDHAPLVIRDLKLDSSKSYVVTQKDWVKLRPQSEVNEYDFVVAIRTATVEPHVPFAEWLKMRLG